MSTLVISAQHIGQTRHCQARDCPHDAEHGYPLCSYCENRRRRGKPIAWHEVVQPKPHNPTTQLCCTRCGEWKPDDQYARASDKGPARRGRKCECRTCDSQTRSAYRARLTPQKKAEFTERDRQRRAHNRTKKQAS